MLWLDILSPIAVSVCCIKRGVVPAFLRIGHNVDRYCLMLNRPVVGIVLFAIYCRSCALLFIFLFADDRREGGHFIVFMDSLPTY